MTEELQQAIDALKECREALHNMMSMGRAYSGDDAVWGVALSTAADAKLRAELVLSLHREVA